MNIVKILILQDCVAFGLELRVREVVQGNGRGENGSSQLVGDAALAVNNFPGSFFRLDERGVLASIRTLAGTHLRRFPVHDLIRVHSKKGFGTLLSCSRNI